jgi:O-acetyl-ADP-ribose deacetylase (regulator of RNase III)
MIYKNKLILLIALFVSQFSYSIAVLPFNVIWHAFKPIISVDQPNIALLKGLTKNVPESCIKVMFSNQWSQQDREDIARYSEIAGSKFESHSTFAMDKSSENKLEVGDVVMTPLPKITQYYNIPSRRASPVWQTIIYAVVPNCKDPQQNLVRNELLKKMYENIFLAAIKSARNSGTSTVALPSLNMSTFGCPLREEIEITLDAIESYALNLNIYIIANSPLIL